MSTTIGNQPQVKKLTGAAALRELEVTSRALADLTLSAVRSGEDVGKFTNVSAQFFSEALTHPDLSKVSTDKLQKTISRVQTIVDRMYNRLVELGVDASKASQASREVYGSALFPVGKELQSLHRLAETATSKLDAVRKLAPGVPKDAVPMPSSIVHTLGELTQKLVETAAATGKPVYTSWSGVPVVAMPSAPGASWSERNAQAKKLVDLACNSPHVDGFREAFDSHANAFQRHDIAALQQKADAFPAGSNERRFLELEISSKRGGKSLYHQAVLELEPERVAAFVEQLKERGFEPIGPAYQKVDLNSVEPGYVFHLNGESHPGAEAAWDAALR